MALEIATGTSRLAEPETDPAGAVPDHGQRGEAELPAALDDLGGTVHGHELFGQLIGALRFFHSCHCYLPL